MNFPRILIRRLSTSQIVGRNKLPTFSVSRQSKIMSKLMHGRDKGKRHWVESRIPGGAHVGSASVRAISNPEGQPKHVLKRVTVLNKLFMRNIADIMATGELSPEILGRGLEISRVKISPDFHQVYVYWLAKGTGEDEELEELLARISGRLRHELSQLRLMGEVPKILFLKDINQSKFADVDRLLAQADFGEDFVPLHMGVRRKEDIARDKDEMFPREALPEMRQDVFGLDREEMMKRITRTISKTKSAWERYEFGAEEEVEPAWREREGLPETLKGRDNQLEERFNQFLLNARQRVKTPERKKFRPEIHVIPRDGAEEDPVDNSLFEEDSFEEEDHPKG